MNTRLRRNILGIKGPAQYQDNSVALKAQPPLESRALGRLPPELEYACLYWANHLKGADTEDPDLIQELEIFSNEHLLHWLEALSWQGQLSSAHGAISTLLKLLVPSSIVKHQIRS